jgi:hypothetical protein
MYLGELLRKKLSELPTYTTEEEAAYEAYLDEVEDNFCFVCGGECQSHSA